MYDPYIVMWSQVPEFCQIPEGSDFWLSYPHLTPSWEKHWQVHYEITIKIELLIFNTLKQFSLVLQNTIIKNSIMHTLSAKKRNGL